jgi:hypothetical protein
MPSEHRIAESGSGRSIAPGRRRVDSDDCAAWPPGYRAVVELPDVLTADSALLEARLRALGPSSGAAVERWRREAQAELVRRRWTRVETSEAS